MVLTKGTHITDCYPFGMPMPDRQIVNGQPYRYAFQGQEKDPETGKEAFELRLWDSRIGRWLTTDPAGQYVSPYLGMGNNPINGIDPDGAFFSRLSAWLFKATNGLWGDEVMKNDYGDWILSGQESDGSPRITVARTNSPFYSTGGNLWNNDFTRNITGDKIDLAFTGSIGSILGINLQLEFSWLLRGKDASFFPYFTLIPTVGSGVELGSGGDFSAELGIGKFSGTVNDLIADQLLGAEKYFAFSASTPYGGVTFEKTKTFKTKVSNDTFTTNSVGITWGAKLSVEVGARANMVRVHPTKGLIGFTRRGGETFIQRSPWKK